MDTADRKRDLVWDGQALAAARARKGYSQWEVSYVLGVRVATVSDWETGKAVPSVERAVAAARMLGVMVMELMRWADE